MTSIIGDVDATRIAENAINSPRVPRDYGRAKSKEERQRSMSFHTEDAIFEARSMVKDLFWEASGAGLTPEQERQYTRAQRLVRNALHQLGWK